MEEVEEYISTITGKGQVTIPAAVRRRLGIKAGGKVVFRLTEGRVELTPPGLSLADTFGAIPPRRQPEDFQELRDLALAPRARRVIEAMQSE